MPTKKTIAVVGATGAQGGAVVRAIMADPDGPFTVRAITRKPDSPQAQALASAGAQVVTGDSDRGETMKAAFDGADAAFCVTNYWEHFSPEREIAQARALAEAAKSAGVAHTVWSTLEDTRRWVPVDDQRMPTLMGKYKVPHFDTKGEADGFFRELGVPTTFMLTSFYWENFIYFGLGPKAAADGVLELTFPLDDAKLPGIAVDDIGRYAARAFTDAVTLDGREIDLAGDAVTMPEAAATLSAAFGRPIGFVQIPIEDVRKNSEDLALMLEWFGRVGYDADIAALTREFGFTPTTLAAWAATKK